MTLSRTIARPLLASSFFYGAVNALRDIEGNARKSAPVTDRIAAQAQRAVPSANIPTDPATWVKIIAGVQLVGGLSLATGRAPRVSSLALAATLVPTSVAAHRFWDEQDPAQKRAHLMHFLQNASIVGGLLIAAGDTEGKPGVAWRTRRAAKDARREGRRLAKEARREGGHLASAARREAKLAKAQLT